MALVVNVLGGLGLGLLGVLVLAEHPGAERFYQTILEAGRSHFGEDWNIHRVIVGLVLLALSLFFLFVSFFIFGAGYNFWVTHI